MPTQRCASTRAVLTGLPASAAIVIVRSSSRSAHQLRGAVENGGALVLGEATGVEGGAAASIALSTSAASPLGTRPIRASS